jgi:excisionase family DNA binding protein
METLYTVEQVAEKFGVHPETVRRLARDHDLPGKKIGKSWRFSDEDLKNFLEGARVNSQEQ